MNIDKIIERISSPDYISGNPLMQSRNGGKSTRQAAGSAPFTSPHSRAPTP